MICSSCLLFLNDLLAAWEEEGREEEIGEWTWGESNMGERRNEREGKDEERGGGDRRVSMEREEGGRKKE